MRRIMLFSAFLGLFAPCLAASEVNAQGGNVSQACGAEPQMPQVDISTIEKYNASVDAVTSYENTARDYNSCVSRQGVGEETAISNDARKKMAVIHGRSTAVQQRISKNFIHLTNVLQQGHAQLQKASHT